MLRYNTSAMNETPHPKETEMTLTKEGRNAMKRLFASATQCSAVLRGLADVATAKANRCGEINAPSSASYWLRLAKTLRIAATECDAHLKGSREKLPDNITTKDEARIVAAGYGLDLFEEDECLFVRDMGTLATSGVALGSRADFEEICLALAED